MATADHSDDDGGADGGRRRALKVATCAIGGAVAAGAGLPLLRYLLFPVGEAIVTSPDTPIDVMDAAELVAGGPAVKLQLIATGVRDAWGVSERVPLGAAWLRKTAAGEIIAFSSICPHLGCAIGYSPERNQFACPCHSSAFSADGDKQSGPAKRGLDRLPVVIEQGRVKVVFKRFRQDVPERVEV